MRRALLAVVALTVAIASAGTASRAWASSADPTTTADAPRVAAAAWYLVGEDGDVLAAQSPGQARAIASITKLMTSIVALEHANVGDVVLVDSRAASLGESTVFLRAGEELSVGDLVRSTLIPSANDAAQALAYHVGGGSADRFVALMNAKAAELGLSRTHFENAHGLDVSGHVSSARDVTTLVRYALGVPFIRDALSRTSFDLGSGREFETTDDLLSSWAPLVGGKTGHTGAAGWSQAAAAVRGDVTVYGAVLGSTTRDARNDALRELLAYGLDQYARVVVVDSGRIYAEAETGYGRPDVELVAPRSLTQALRRGTPLVERVVGPASVELPVAAGAKLGRVELYAGQRLVATSNLVAAKSISEPGFFGKVRWYATATVENLWEVVT